MIEIEFRARFLKDEYDRLKTILDEQAECLGPDDKRSTYYIFKDKLLKVVHNISKKDAKISLKMNRLGEGSAFQEIEVHFPEKDIDSMKEILSHLDLTASVAEEGQQRINYNYKGCEIALKWGKTWGYHLEIEKMISDPSLQERIKNEIQSIADELHIQLMTEEEIAKFVKEFEDSL